MKKRALLSAACLVVLLTCLSVSGAYAAFTVVTGTSVTASNASGTAPSGMYGAGSGIGWYANTSGTIFGSNSTINTKGNTAIFADGFAGSSYISGSNLTIITDGTAALAVQAVASTIKLDNSRITTTGENGAALVAYTFAGFPAAQIIGNNLQIDMTGSGGYGVSTAGGAVITLNSSTLNTFYTGGLGVSDAGSLFSGSNLTVNCSPLYNALYVDNASGVGAAGAILNSSTLNGSVRINRTNSYFSGTNLTVNTTNDVAAISVTNSATASLNIVKVTTSGSNAGGLNASSLANVNAVNTQISTSGNGAYGVYSGALSTVSFNGSTVDTSGSGANGLYSSMAVISATNVKVSTTGDGSHGAFSAGTLSLISSTVSTTGSGANGIVISGSNAKANTDAATRVSTTGVGAHGISVQLGATKTYDGSVGNVLPNVTVSGSGAAVVDASGTNSQLTLKNIALNTNMTQGAGTWGAKAESAGKVTFDNGSTGATGLWSASGGLINFVGSGSANGSRTKVDANGKFDISVSTVSAFTIGSLEGAGSVVLGNNNLIVGGYTTTADSASTLFSGTISGAGSLIKQGVGVLTLSGSNAFAYTGSTSIKDGVIAIRNIADPTTFTKAITLEGGWLDLSDAAGFQNSPEDGNNPNQWNNLTILSGNNAANGGVIGANDNMTYAVGSGTQTIVYQIGSSTVNTSTNNKCGLYVVKTGTGTLVLNGSNQYMGNTRIENGILQVNQNANLGDVDAKREVVLGKQADVNSSGTLQIVGSFNSNRKLELRQDGTVDVNSGVSTTFGSIGADLNNVTHTLTKNGVGEFIVNGQSNLAGLIVNDGHINLGGGANLDSGTNSAIFMNNGTATINSGTVKNSSGDLIVAASGSASVLNLSSLTASASNANLVSINNGSNLTLTDIRF